jgi:uncharacterized damage-inducible protein DinB
LTDFASAQFKTLYGYHWHAIGRLLDCAARLTEAGYRENPGYGHGAIHDLFFHLLRTDCGWRNGLQTGKQQAPLKPADYPDLAGLRAGFAAEQAAWTALLDSLTAEQVEGQFDLTDWRGETHSMSRWRILQHVVLHGMQHQAELAERLSRKGQSPGDLDFIFYE